MISPGYTSWIPLLRSHYPEGQLHEVRLANGELALSVLRVPAGVRATPQEAGLRGTIRPTGDAPPQERRDPALAFIKLNEVAGSTEYEARWEGRLLPPGDGRYRLEIVTNGAITLTLDGETVAGTPSATNDPQVIEVPGALESRTYDFALKGTWTSELGILNLYWRKDDGDRILVPPSAFLPEPAR